jgi:cytochrome c5
LAKSTVVGGLLAVCVLAGCAKEQSGAEATAQSDSQQLQPQDTALAAIYDRSCRSCHTIAATGAPLTGDSQAWALRLDKGMDTLVDNVVNGFGGMPPFGMCMDCGVEEFEGLIRFMAQIDANGDAVSD